MVARAKVGNGLDKREGLNPSRTSTRRKVSGCSNLKSSCGQTSGWEEEAAHTPWTSEHGLRGYLTRSRVERAVAWVGKALVIHGDQGKTCLGQHFMRAPVRPRCQNPTVAEGRTSLEDSGPGVSCAEEWCKPLGCLRTRDCWRNVWGPACRPAWGSLRAGPEDGEEGSRRSMACELPGGKGKGEVL